MAVAVPAGWLFLRLVLGSTIEAELGSYFSVYAYMLMAALVPFTAFAAFVGHREERLLEDNEKLDALSVTDATTGLKNVRYFRARLAEACGRSPRDHQPVAVAMIDLDRFKSVNDRFGHPIGDRVLRAAARAIASVARRDETAARVGGEEFAVILPGNDADSALAAAERIRRAVSAVAISTDAKEPIRVTASVGVASTAETGSSDPDELFEAADRALLQAKRSGRNKSVAALARATRPQLHAANA